MLDSMLVASKYNRLPYLDGLEDRLIYYLISPNNKSEAELKLTHNIWKLLYYNDYDALNEDLPTYNQIANLIYNDGETQTDKRIFRSPHFEDGWAEQCTLLKIYVDGIYPENRYKAIVNVGIDIVTHNKCVNIATEEDDDSYKIDTVDGVDIRINAKSRITTLAKSVIGLLNGRQVQGVGLMEFTQEYSRFEIGKYGIWNNRNFEGMKIVMGVRMSGVD